MKKFFFAFLTLISGGLIVEAAEPKQVVSIALADEPPQLDSTKATDTISGMVIGHVKEGLTRYDAQGKPVPGVAERWEINDKGATFTLRKNAKWQDGKAVTAKDFVFAWRTVVNPKTASEYAFIMFTIKNAEKINKGQATVEALGVTAKDDHTLVVEFERPCGYFTSLTAFPTFFPVRQDFYEAQKGKYAADAANMLGNGPFKISKWVHGASMLIEKNDHYWNAKNIALDAINVPYITSDTSARYNFFKDKKIDFVSLSKEEIKKAVQDKLSIKNFSEGTVFYLEYNFRPGRVTTNANLRKAIQLAFDVNEYVGKVVGVPGTKPMNRLIPSTMPGLKSSFQKDFPVAAVKKDVALAKKHLALALKELGLKSPPALHFLTGDSPFSAREAEYFQNVFKTVLGIELKIDKQIFKQRLAKMVAGNFDIVAAGWGPDYLDAMTYADLFTSWNENNRGLYKSQEVDQAIRKAMGTANAKIRLEEMAKAERTLLEEMAILPLYERAAPFVQSPRVEGIVRHSVGADPDFTFARIVNNK